MSKTTRLVGLTAGALIVGFAVAPAAIAATEVHVDARLHGSSSFSRATGFSEYERAGTQRDVEVTVNHVARLAGKTLKVYVNGNWVGTMPVRSTGFAHREWDTDHGQRVPFAAAGDPVRVRTMGGKLIASGIYLPEHD